MTGPRSTESELTGGEPIGDLDLISTNATNPDASPLSCIGYVVEMARNHHAARLATPDLIDDETLIVDISEKLLQMLNGYINNNGFEDLAVIEATEVLTGSNPLEVNHKSENILLAPVATALNELDAISALKILENIKAGIKTKPKA